MPDDRPNILILMPDQQRADSMGCAGHPQVRTPNMDRIAAEGVRFTHACTSGPLCMPARASFLCGRRVQSHGIWENRGELEPDDDSLFGQLRRAGYLTAHVGKSHYYEHGGGHMREREGYMRARGFDYVHETTGPWATVTTDSAMTDEWRSKGLLEAFREDYRRRRAHEGVAVWPSPLPVEDFLDSYVGRQGVRFIEQYDGEAPFALFVGFGGPHEPWDAPGEYAAMYDPAETPPPVAFGEPEQGDWLPQHAAEWERKGRRGLSADDVRRLRAGYYGKITLIDDWVGRILDACERRGLLDDLLIVFWSDHGEMAGDHGLLYKSRFFEGALRVPLMLRWPGRIPAGQQRAALAQTVDIMPTVLEAAGAPARPRCEGESLWPVLRDPAARFREAALSQVGHAGRRNTMVRTERWKCAVHEDGTPYMLYDLEADPDETRNLLGHPDARGPEAEMRGLLREITGQDAPGG